MLINTYVVDEKKPMGFGDFIRGCAACHQLSLEEGFKFDVDLGPFLKYYKKPNVFFNQPKRDLYMMRNIGTYHELKSRLIDLVGGIDNLRKETFKLNTNCWPKNTIEHIKLENQRDCHKGWGGNIGRETKEFLKSRLIPTSNQFQQMKKVKGGGYEQVKYEVVHVRAGDQAAFKDSYDHAGLYYSEIGIASFILLQILDILKETDKQIIILSDSSGLKDFINKIAIGFNSDRIRISEVTAKHAGAGGLYETFHDLNILVNAEKIHQFSVYDWGSGFSTIANEIYDVPIITYPKVNPYF